MDPLTPTLGRPVLASRISATFRRGCADWFPVCKLWNPLAAGGRGGVRGRGCRARGMSAAATMAGRKVREQGP